MYRNNIAQNERSVIKTRVLFEVLRGYDNDGLLFIRVALGEKDPRTADRAIAL